MDKHLIREYRARYQAVAAIEIQEQRSATMLDRWRQLTALWRLGVELGPAKSNWAGEEGPVYQRWAKLKGAK